MNVDANLRQVIDSNTALWAGEAEVFRTYWMWEGRTRETDRTWLARQCFKEIWGSGVGDKNLGLFLGPVEQLKSVFPKIDTDVHRHKVLEVIDFLRAEFAHYCAFADAHDAMAEDGEERLNPALLEGWEADDELARLRYLHRKNHGTLGARAARITEGGYCTLYFEGMKLRDNGGRDESIARACSQVYEDEFKHMLEGIVGLGQENLSVEQWHMLEEMTLAQSRQRIRMRNEQFNRPLSEARIQEIYDGNIEAIEFDYAKANLPT